MSENQEFSYKKISDLIKDTDGSFFNFDTNNWIRNRKEEIIEPINGEIIGEIPNWISGSFILNGPGTFKVGDVSLNHVFDGMALLHRFHIDNGNVTYQCRFIKSEAYEKVKSENRLAFNEFGTTTISNGSFIQKVRAFFSQNTQASDNTLVTVYPLDSEIYAITETPMIRKFNPKTLETLERYDLNKYTNIIFQPAHPQLYDGNLYQCGLTITSEGSKYNIFCIPQGENKFDNIKMIAKVPARRKFSPGYMHSFGITENYFIIIEQPLSMPAFQMKIATYLKTPFVNAFKWLKDENTYIFLVDRVTGEVKHTFEADGFFYFHTINQYENDGHVVLDLSCYNDADIIKGLMVDNMVKLKKEKIKTNMLNSRVLRFVMPLNVPKEENAEKKNIVTLKGVQAEAFIKSDGTIFVVPEVLCDTPMEFGTIWYDKHLGKYYKYFYGVGYDVHAEYPCTLIKVDVENKTRIIWKEKDAYPSEPLFIPAKDAKSEDDGVVIASITYGESEANRVTLLVLDAKTFTELGRCEFKNLSDPVSKTFHGWFLDERV
ncbi:carotenoid isomerooxygenase-like [Chironomus tepperi]|uniref:carotenoid isomerooxygenase-like n=1 Tax=Chironomus tepperi TaxID=113505 RepID=UPI00391FAE58